MQEWDQYWAKDRATYNDAYDWVAVFYRKHIIRPYLRQYCNSNFPPGSVVLHAGCGGGQVEEGCGLDHSVIGLDISPNALKLYRRHHGQADLILGNIKSLGVKDGSLDGIYNLGVMEHFSESDIQLILREFHRVLKMGGVVVLFWPPRFGLTVFVLKIGHCLLNALVRKDIQLHPPEPSLIKSSSHVRDMVEKAGFTVKKTDFGIGDLYTYMVVVMEKPA